MTADLVPTVIHKRCASSHELFYACPNDLGVSMGRFTVDPVSLNAVQAAIADTVAHSYAAFNGLRAAANELRWHGCAAVDFRVGWSEWIAGIEHLLGSLHELGAAVGLSASGYASTETQIRAAAAGTPS